MLYPLLKIIVRLALKVFFKSIKVQNPERIPSKGPMIVVSNHPNTFMDPLVVAALIRSEVYFLANSSIFSSGFTKWLFAKLHMIPIQRKFDTNKEKVDNAQIFEKCYNFLGDGGTLLIFPEGTSVRERKLRKLKTGTARIALGAEEKFDFNLDLKIVSLGLNYSKPESFRSEVFVNVAEVISIQEYQEAFQKDAFQATQEITEQMRLQLEENIIITQDAEDEQLMKEIETVYKSQLSQEIELSEEEKEQDFLISKGIADAVTHFNLHEPERIQAFRPKIKNYLDNLESLNINDEFFTKRKSQGLVWSALQTALYFILGFPLFLYGLLNNYIPYILPSQVGYKVVKMSKVEEYIAPVMMITGIFTFPIFYGLQIWTFHWLTQDFWLTLVYFISLPLTGFFALFYVNYFQSTRNKWRVFSLFFKKTALVSQLIAKRTEILQELEKAKEDYLTFYKVKSNES